jgi:polyhydroxybutyrate depolymerase
LKILIVLSIIIILSIINGSLFAQTGDSIKVRKWKVDDVKREAIMYVPASAKLQPSPIIFVFHGHGGNMKNMFYSHRFDQLWPEAIVVVAQGLKTPGKLVDPKGNLSGWQQAPGDMGDRDLHFFDAMLRTLQNEYNVNDRQIYATGHSNGGNFTYMLWAMRADILAAVAPSAAAAFGFESMLNPKPVLHILGKNDRLVKPEWQTAQVNRLLKLNQCDVYGKRYEKHVILYISKSGNPVLVYEHSEGHVYPQEADAVVVKFFKDCHLAPF